MQLIWISTTLRYRTGGGVALKFDLLFPSCETLGSVINFLGLRCSCGQDTMMTQGRRDLIPNSICEFNMQIDRVEMQWLECLLCHLSFYGTWLSSCHIQPYSFLVAHSQSRLKGGSGQFAESLHPRTVTTLALFCAKIAVNSLVVIGREVSTSLWQKMRHSTNGLGWFWQTEALMCPSKLPGLPQLVLVTPDSSGLSSVAGDDCWRPWQVAMWAVGTQLPSIYIFMLKYSIILKRMARNSSAVFLQLFRNSNLCVILHVMSQSKAWQERYTWGIKIPNSATILNELHWLLPCCL